MLSYGEQAPEFELPAVPKRISLRGLCNQGKVLLVFFSEADTPLCTRQLQPFVSDYEDIKGLGGQVVAISADDLERLEEFRASIGAPFPMASDADLSVSRQYGVVAEDGQTARRGVFVIDRGGRILHANADYVPSNPSEYEAAVMSLSTP